MDGKNVGIYIHVPFCVSKCYYCDFCSCPNVSEDKIDLYVERLCGDIKNYSLSGKDEYRSADTVYFGGGTPSLLKGEYFEKILYEVNKRFYISRDAEITSECNPGTLDKVKLSNMKNAGINRLSIGLQSVNQDELSALGRIHSYKEFNFAVESARKLAFENISADLMLGIPNQNLKSFENSLREIAGRVEHISAYMLKIEENTPFYRVRKTLNLPDEDETCDMYKSMSDILAEYGYNKYEISNFSKPTYESKHNLKYWKYDDYVGFGPAAHSFVYGERTENSRDIDSYINGKDICISKIKISCKESMNEYVMLRMRLKSGIDKFEFENRFRESFDKSFGKKFLKYSPEYVIYDDKICAFTERGMLVSNFILSDVLNFEL